jgi:competence ComEA-like helix-hairpin-helix protein
MKKRNFHDKPASAGVGVLILLFFLMAMNFLKNSNSLPGTGISLPGGKVFVQVSGDIRFPGVYGFDGLPSLRDLVDRSKGLIPEDKIVPFSVGPPLESGSRVEITKRKEFSLRIGEMSAFYRTTLGMPISINTENADGLISLPGIGARTAEAIVEERTRRGGFKKLSDIQSIRGIGPGLYRKIRPYLVLR